MKFRILGIWVVLLSIFPLGTASPAFGGQGDFERPLIFGVSPVADYGMYEGDGSYRDLVWQRLAEIGCRTVRLDASWREIEEKRGERVWDDVDSNVQRAREIGAEPVMLIVNTPGWASPTGKPVHDYPPREEMAEEFESFCQELASRYKGLVSHYEFWNEENGWGWHVDRGFQRADEYIPWLRRAYRALKRGNPECKVALGGMDDAQGHAWGFLEKFYKYRNEWYPGEDFLDAVADHPYSPDVATMKAKLHRLKEIMAANGDGEKPLWITEYGWSLREVTEEEQAQKLQSFLNAFASDELSFVEIANYLCIADFELSHVGIGLTDGSLRQRPAFEVMRDHPLNDRPFHYAVEVSPSGVGALRVDWKTREACKVAAEAFAGDQLLTHVDETAEESTKHGVLLENLPSGEVVDVIVSAPERTADRPPIRYKSVVPKAGVVNGDFEAGFLGGTALGWFVQGKPFAYDSSQPWLKLIHGGNHAQVVHVRGGKGTPLYSVLEGTAIVNQGEPAVLGCWSVAVTGDGSDPVARWIGVNTSGVGSPEDKDVVWSEPVFGNLHWQKAEIRFTPSSTLLSVYVKIDVAGTQDGGEYNVYVDDVTMEAAGTTAQ